MDTEKIDLNLLITLDALLLERNVSRAAKQLHISQPALSARLSRLRDLIGDPLLVPSPRGMVPTPKALELQNPLHSALETVKQVLRSHQEFDPKAVHAVLSIAASDYCQSVFLSGFPEIIRCEAPHIKMIWRTLDPQTIAQQLEAGEVDLAVMSLESAPSQMRWKKLYEEPYVVIARKGHPQISDKMTLAQFCDQSHVIVSPNGGGFSGATDKALAVVGYERRVALSAPGFLIVPEIISQSDLIAVVPSRLAKIRQKNLGIQIFSPPVDIASFEIGLIWHDRTMATSAGIWLRQRLSQLTENLDQTNHLNLPRN